MTVGVAHRAPHHDPFHNPTCSERIATIPVLVFVWTSGLRVEFGFTNGTGRVSHLHCELTPAEFIVGILLLLASIRAIMSWGLALGISRTGFIHKTGHSFIKDEVSIENSQIMLKLEMV